MRARPLSCLSRRSFERLRRQWELALARRLSVLRASEGETCEWLNVMLARLWDSTIAPLASAEVVTYLDAKMDAMLKAQDAKTTFPSWVKGLRMGEVKLGSAAPIVRSFCVPEGAAVDQTSGAGERMLAPDTLVDVAFEFLSDDLKCTIELEVATNRVLRAIFRSQTASVFVTVTNLRVEGVCRLRLRPSETAVLAALTDTPKLTMSLHLQGRIKQTRVNLSLTDLPGVQEMVASIINEVLAEGYVWPRFMPTFLPPPSPTDKQMPQFGIMNVTVVAAAGLKQRQVSSSAAEVSVSEAGEKPWQQRAARLAGKGTDEVRTVAARGTGGLTDAVSSLGACLTGGAVAGAGSLPGSPRKLAKTPSGRHRSTDGTKRGVLDLSIWLGTHADLLEMGLDDAHVAKEEFSSEARIGRSVLRVHLAEARELLAKDAGGTSDPYAEVYVSGQTEPVRTKTHYRNLNPVFETTFDIEVDTARPSMVMIRLWDEDYIGSDEFLGQLQLPLKLLAAEAERRARLAAAGVDQSSVNRPVWRRLEGRSKRSSVAGDLKVAAYLVDETSGGVGSTGGAGEVNQSLLSAENAQKDQAAAAAAAENGPRAPSEAPGAARSHAPGTALERKAVEARAKARLAHMRAHGSYLFVRVDGARGLLNLDEGEGNLSDPYCVLELGAAVLVTRTIEDDLNPEWEETFAFPIAKGQTSVGNATLEATLFDDDEKLDECLGQCRLRLADILAAGVDKPTASRGCRVMEKSISTVMAISREESKAGCAASIMKVRSIAVALDDGPAKLKPMVDFHWSSPVKERRVQHITTPSGSVRWAGEVPSSFACPNAFPATDYFCFSVRNKGRLSSPLLGQCIVNANWAPDGGCYYAFAGWRGENHNPTIIRAPPNTAVDLWVPLEASGGRGKLHLRMKAEWKYGHAGQAPDINWRSPAEVEAWLEQLNADRHRAATTIQAVARGYLARRNFSERLGSAVGNATSRARGAVNAATAPAKKAALKKGLRKKRDAGDRSHHAQRNKM